MTQSSLLTSSHSTKKPFSFWLSLLLLLCIALIIMGFFYWQNQQKPKVEVLTREAIITKVQTLNRLQTVVYNIDTVITSQKQGNWYALWQDEQKGLFVAHGRVQAGIDLNLLTPENVKISEDGNHIQITLPPAQIFETYLDNIEVYDLKTGLFGMVDTDPQIFNQAQSSGKKQILMTACRSNILQLATDNAQKQIQSLFSLANIQVSIQPSPTKPCA